MGAYTDTTKIYGLTRVTLTSSSVPSINEVNQWITEVEGGIVDKGLGVHTATDELIDVPSKNSGESVYNYEYNSDQDIISFGENLNGVTIPLTNARRPIISVNHLYKNDNSYTATPEWEELAQGPADGSEYLLLKGGDKQHGYALYIYNNAPLPGPQRLKMDYTYGLNINNGILSEYCTKLVAITILQARMGTNSIDGLAYVDGGDLGVAFNTRYAERISEWRTDIADIESKYFPQDQRKAGIPHIVI